MPTSETDLRRHFRLEGVEVDAPQGSIFKVTKFDAAICTAQNLSAVDNVVALAGHKAGVFISQDGRKVLVPRGPRVIVPLPGEWKNFEGLLAELFGGKQLLHVLSWLKVMLEDLLTFTPSAWRHSQMLVLVGDTACGKSFFQKLITALAGGRENDPYSWMVGKSDFNEHIAESEHLAMGDKQPFRDQKSRGNFASKIKELAVNSELAIHGKGKKQFSAPCFRRLSLSANHDSDYLTVIPMLDESVKDKLMLVKCSKATMVDDFGENMARFTRELPAFAHYLLREFTIPESMRSQRFGVTHYLNPEVVEMLEDFEPHLKFLALVDGTFFAKGEQGFIRETPEKLHAMLVDSNSPLHQQARLLLSNSIQCGLMLTRLAAAYPARFKKSKSQGVRRWTIASPETAPETSPEE
jgi:hypothetical protein